MATLVYTPAAYLVCPLFNFSLHSRLHVTAHCANEVDGGSRNAIIRVVSYIQSYFHWSH